MEQVFQDVAPYEYMKQFCHNSNAFIDDSCSHCIILCIYCTKSYCPCFFSLAIQPIYFLLFIFHSAMIQLSNYAHPLKRGMMFNYYAISNIYTCFAIAILKSKAVGLELKPEYTNAYA